MQLILVEDEESVSRFIKKGFVSEGYQIDVAFDGTIAKSLFEKKPYDLAILDINLPGLNGYQLCQHFKKINPYIPVIFLTALDSIDDKVAGFESGADDYLVKPFEFKELLLRTKALIRRSTHAGNATLKLVIADLEMDTSGKIVSRAGKRLDLTAREYSLLEYLMINKGRGLDLTAADILKKHPRRHKSTTAPEMQIGLRKI